MTTTELNVRIAKVEEKIAKKHNTITKKIAMIEKKNATAKKLYNVDDLTTYDRWTDTDHDEETKAKINWDHFDVVHLGEDIIRNKQEIEAATKTLEKYKAQLEGQAETETVYTNEVPEAMKTLQTALEHEWNEYDKKRRAYLQEQKRILGYKDFIKKHGGVGYELCYKTNEEIEKENARDAKTFVLNLYYRVKEITGTVTSWNGIRLEMGNAYPVLTGIVVGQEGRASVETILAGGYNIQRLHIRTLVHSI